MPSLRQRIFAWIYYHTEGMRSSMIGKDKQNLLSEIGGKVVEIGIGTGDNMQYYQKGTSIIAIEPNTAMYPYIKTNSDTYGIDVQAINAFSENLPLDSGSADAIVTTHVLCSVQSVAQSLKEILRVLKPGGTFYFLEHVAAKERLPLRTFQDWINPLHSVLFSRCQCNRETWKDIESAGFADLSLNHINRSTMIKQVTPHIIGTAHKPNPLSSTVD